MSHQAPPTLLQLSIRSLLKDEALAISALNDLPIELFPPLFKDAFDSKKTTVLRLMVAAWPFPCLPVGALIKTSHLETLKAVLDGLDLLMTQKVLPIRWKLQELDLRDEHHNFWNVWAGTENSVCSPGVIDKNQPMVYYPTREGKKAMTVLMNFSIKSQYPCKSLRYIYQWAKQRKDVLQVICLKLQFWTSPAFNPLELLEILEPGSIQELEVCTGWDLGTLACIAPGLGQMKNLQKLSLSKIYMPWKWHWAREMRDKCFTELIRQFSKLHKIQHLCLDDVCFLGGCLDQVLRCFQGPLETLAITHCMLSSLDMCYLSRCPSIHQLKHLDLSGVPLSYSLLRKLPERLTATLQTLRLENCTIVDSQISALLPVLSQCTQLTEVNFLNNFLCMDSLKKLLQDTANLRQLTREMYPAPTEVYDERGAVLPGRFTQCCSELMSMLMAIRQPKEAYFVSEKCKKCHEFCTYNLEATLCSCLQ
ncbi:PRAME family member 12-like [Acomys russatus]|uniref:PRAME family member 12-like n=1 Tax=Acomys russatus TaxID=60746 RepID=UPI0021E279E3|nr:PRAME family member 12-like [Acomys russatus]